MIRITGSMLCRLGGLGVLLSVMGCQQFTSELANRLHDIVPGESETAGQDEPSLQSADSAALEAEIAVAQSLEQEGKSEQAIEAYLRWNRLGCVQDPSNADDRLARGRLRQQLWPQLAEAFDHAETGLAASARRAQEAAACLKELAAQDLPAACAPDGALQVPKWLVFSAARRANLLRAWLAQNHCAGIPETLVQRLMHELPQARAARWPLGPGQLRCHAGLLRFAASAELPQAAPDATRQIDLSRIGRHELPDWGGAFEVRAVASSGLSPLRLRHCELRARSGGENFQRTTGSVPRSLKKQYQSHGLPAWQRDGPLVYVGNELLFVPGLGIDARRHADEGRPMLGLSWLRGSTP
jgi:tRNA(Ile)-lysidine synthase